MYMEQSLNISLKQRLEYQLYLIQNLESTLDTITELTMSFSKDDSRLIKEVSELYLSSNPDLNKDTIERSLVFASKLHINDFRDSGEPYSAHPFQVGYIVADWHLGQNAVIVGVLHDVLEHSKDKYGTMNSMYDAFGLEILVGVSGLSGDFKKIEDSNTRNAELYKKLNDFGSIFKMDYLDYVKVADGITNLYTKKSMCGKDGLPGEERQEKFCSTARKHLLPIAKRLDRKSRVEIKLVPYINDLIKR